MWVSVLPVSPAEINAFGPAVTHDFLHIVPPFFWRFFVQLVLRGCLDAFESHSYGIARAAADTISSVDDDH